jgi:hypothetical protein
MNSMKVMSGSNVLRVPILFVLVFAAWSQTVSAQMPEGKRSMFRVYGGLGFVSSEGGDGIFNGGFGGEYFLLKGFSVGGDAGYLGPLEGPEEGFGNLNVNASYHFLTASETRKIVPFVSGGYTLFFREGSANLFNIGGGIIYWMDSGKGWRFEVRDQIWSDYGTYHYVSFNVGFVF